MYLQSNPYNWQQVNPDFLYGNSRLTLVSGLKNGLSNGRSFGMTGGRRMGKTTLLRRVEKEILKYSQEAKNGGLLIVPVYIETLAIQSPISSAIIYQEIIQRLNQCLRDQDIDLPLDFEIYDPQTLKDYLCQAINLVTSHRLQIIFMFDEIELISQASWGRSFFANWRSLLSNTPSLQEYLSAVFCGANEMFKISRDVGSPLGNILEWQELELLSLEDTSRLLCEPIQYAWTDDFIEEVFTLTGGHPFIIQYLMQTVCNFGLNRANQSLEEAKRQFLRNQRFQFKNWWDKFDSSTRMIYARLAEGNSLSRKSILKEFGDASDQSISVLSHTGVANYNWETGYLKHAGSLFKEWFEQFGDLNVTPDIASIVDELLKNLERKLRKLLTTYFDSQKNSWLRNHYEKNNPKKWNEIIRRIQKKKGHSLSEDQKISIGNEEILRRLDFGDLFEIITMKNVWDPLCAYFKYPFSNLSSDKKIALSRLEERKDLLVNIRNDLRHVNEDEIESTALLKAQVFSVELLESLSFLPNQNDLY
jgi:hypothetical protein